jgi:DNA-binding response OmpR family regulator
MGGAPQAILVVDDDKNQRNMLAFALRDKGFDVVAVESGALAVEEAATRLFDAAICDIMMPGMNGVETLKNLRKTQPGLEVIMATAYATPALAAASLGGGACSYIAKPYELKELFALLEQALSRQGK